MSAKRKDMPAAWVDPDDAPELTDEWFDKADIKLGDKLIKRGRPKGSNKSLISLRVDDDVLAKFRSGGAGWQSRMNEALRKAV